MNNSLNILAEMCDSVDVIVKNFKPYNWKGYSVNCLKYLNNNSNKTNILYDVNRFQLKDDLYVGLIDTNNILAIYSTDHLIWSHPVEGHSTIDILYRGNLEYELISCTPKHKYRTFDNKSVEFYYLDQLLDKKYITIGLYNEKFGGENRNDLLKGMLGFLDNINNFFHKSNSC